MEWLRFLSTGIIDSILFYLPAIAFNLAVYLHYVLILDSNLLPLDGGMKVGGKPLIGAGRGVDGLYVAVLVGFFFGLANGRFAEAFYLAIGAQTGTVVSSIIKRRTSRRQGESFFPLDHIDFLLGATLLYASQFEMYWARFWFGLAALGMGHLFINKIVRPRFEHRYAKRA